MAWDSVWEKIFKDNEWGKYPDLEVIKFVARNFYQVENRKTIRILEIGSGTGANIWFMAREGFDTYGIDGSKSGIERAKLILEKEGLSAQFQLGDINDIDSYYDENYFDAIIDIECLCCNSKKSTILVIDKLNKILKPGGLFLSKTFTNSMYKGQSYEEVAIGEYTEVTDGPLAGKGLVRLSSETMITEIYGQSMEIKSLDLSEVSSQNRAMTISEWIIVCKSI